MSGPDDLTAKAAALEGELLGKGEGPKTEEPGGEIPPPSKYGAVLGKLLFATFKLMAPAWRVTPEECSLLGESYGDVVDAFFPDLDFGKKLESVLLAGVLTSAVFGERLGTPMHEPKPAEETNPADGKEKKPG